MRITHCILAFYEILFLFKLLEKFNKKECPLVFLTTPADFLEPKYPACHQPTHRNLLALLPPAAPLVLFFPGLVA